MVHICLKEDCLLQGNSQVNGWLKGSWRILHVCTLWTAHCSLMTELYLLRMKVEVRVLLCCFHVRHLLVKQLLFFLMFCQCLLGVRLHACLIEVIVVFIGTIVAALAQLADVLLKPCCVHWFRRVGNSGTCCAVHCLVRSQFFDPSL